MKFILTQILSFTLIISSLSSLGQNYKGKISGTITDGDSKYLEAATICLLHTGDTAIYRFSVADKEGHFVFENIPDGSYIVSITAIGHKAALSESFILNGNNNQIQLKTIVLETNTKELKAVSVVGRKPLIEQKIDRTVINVDAAVTNVGATALEVLEKSPGITIDKDGKISLKGKQGVQIYIDGRPSYLSGDELVNLLKNMNASQLEQIEIMTNPPAKYEAAGNSGIINLKTKKNKLQGFNGSIGATFSQGIYWKTNESLNLNYRSKKYNLFLNYNFGRSNNYQQLTIHRTYKKEDAKTIDALFDQVARMPHYNINDNLKIGADFFLSKKTTVGFVASGFLNPEQFKSYNTSYLKNPDNQVDSIVYATSSMKDTWKNGNVNLNFRHQFDSTGRELTVDADYSIYGSHNRQNFVNTSYFPDWTKKNETDLYSEVPVNISIYSVKSDYVHPLKNELKFETGIKSSYVTTDNAANFFNVSNGNYSPDYQKTNRFLYKENINAAYINFSKQFKKLGVQTGLRFENTNYRGQQLGNPQRPDSSFQKSYNSLFPTAFLSYNASKSHQFGFSFGRRIDRPSYQDLNPFLFFLDNYTYEAGNPYIRPQYTINFELSHTFKGFLTTTLNYSRTKDFMNETFEQKGYATVVRNGNIGLNHNAGISVAAQIPVAKWWSANVYANYTYTNFKGLLYGENINLSAANFTFNADNQFTFSKGWSAELGGFYRSKGLDGQILIHPFGQVNAGTSKQIMKGKGTLRLNVRNVFNSNLIKGNINFQRTEAYFTNLRNPIEGSISFTYRFGKPHSDQQDQRRHGSIDEQNRVKGGR